MTSLRDRLEAKTARRVVVPVQVSEPGEALARAEQAAREVQLLGALGRATDEERTAAEAKAEKARQAVAEHYLNVELAALRPDAWEAIIATHTPAEGSEDPFDWEKVLPVALAECAVDESLRDADWWARQLGSGAWSWGDVHALRQAVLHINGRGPDVLVPKG